MLEFIPGFTFFPGELREIYEGHIGKGSGRISSCIVSPLAVGSSVLEYIRGLQREGGVRVIFDSSAFQCLQGKITYEELQKKLREMYLKEDWADLFILPDIISTGTNREENWERAIETLEKSYKFFLSLPDEIKPRCIPVIQGRELLQIEVSIQFYRSAGFKIMAFGGVGTFYGKIKQYTSQDWIRLRYLRERLREDEQVHIFGVGSTSYLWHLKEFMSTDSTSWVRKAGMRQVIFPCRGQEGIDTLTDREIEGIKEGTGHSCYWCKDTQRLRKEKIYLTLHNLEVILDAVRMVNEDGDSYLQLLRRYSPAVYKKGMNGDNPGQINLFCSTENFWEEQRIN